MISWIRNKLRRLLSWAMEDGPNPKKDKSKYIEVLNFDGNVTILKAVGVSDLSLVCVGLNDNNERLVRPSDVDGPEPFTSIWKELGGKSSATWPDGTPCDLSELFG